MADVYLAKSEPKQTVQEHTEELLELLKEFLKIYGNFFTNREKTIIADAALYHDFGKLSPHFQGKLQKNIAAREKRTPGDPAEIPHGFLSCAYLNTDALREIYTEDELRVLVTAVYNHHLRKDMYDDETLINYLEAFMPEEFAYAPSRILYRNDEYLDYVMQGLRNTENGGVYVKEAEWLRYLVVKGMLNRLDYAASGAHIDTLEIQPLEEGALTRKICEKLNANVDALRPVQKYMLRRKDRNIITIAATGSGKTEGALFWLDGSKCFYTLPLKVSINAIYERVLNQYAYDAEKITLLHSDLLAYYFTQMQQEPSGADDPLLRREKAKLLSYPLTICTVDQLFWFVFKAIGSELVPATLKYAKLVIDEIQMYSPEILACLIYGLRVITKLGGRFAIITATFPPVLEHFLKAQGIPFEISEPFLGEYKRRHKITILDEDFDCVKIAELGLANRVLVLCNTVTKAQAVHAQLKDFSNVRLLHSRFIRKDRKTLEEAIQAFSHHADSGIWISTQIVEASLDIDFDLLFTEMCPADSLLQRMGRCYRKREYAGELPNVYIHHTQNGYGTVYPYKDIYDCSLAYLRRYDQEYFPEAEKFDYIREVYATERLRDGAYYKEIEQGLRALTLLQPAVIDVKKAHEQFRDIQSLTVMPDAFYQQESVQEWIEILRDRKKYDMRTRIKAENDLMQYTISLDARILYNPARRNFIDKKPIEKIPWLGIHRCFCRYDFDGAAGTGLILEQEDAQERFAL